MNPGNMDSLIVEFGWKYFQLMDLHLEKVKKFAEQVGDGIPLEEEVIKECENILTTCKAGQDSLSRVNKEGQDILEELIAEYKKLKGGEVEKQPKERQAIHEVDLSKKITLEESDKVRLALRNQGYKGFVAHISVDNADLRSLLPFGWLTATIINAYCALLKEGELREFRVNDKLQKCQYFSSYFVDLLDLQRQEYNAIIQAYTENLDCKLLDCDKVFFPIHVNKNHWCLIVIDIKSKKFLFLDSLNATNPNNNLYQEKMEKVANYFKRDALFRSREDIDLNSWKREVVRGAPQQNNSYDCGVFVLEYVKFYSRGLDPCFSQDDIVDSRRRMLLEIVNNRILDCSE